MRSFYSLSSLSTLLRSRKHQNEEKAKDADNSWSELSALTSKGWILLSALAFLWRRDLPRGKGRVQCQKHSGPFIVFVYDAVNKTLFCQRPLPKESLSLCASSTILLLMSLPPQERTVTGMVNFTGPLGWAMEPRAFGQTAI